MMLNSMDADSCGDMAFASPGSSNQNNVFRILYELARWSCRTVASLMSLDAKSKPARSFYDGKRATFVW